MNKTSLPEGWRIVKFGDLAASITERVDDPKVAGVEIYVGLEHLDPDTTKISRFGTPEDVESTKLRFYPGDVIYARRRAYQRKLGVAEVEGICSAHALVLRARPEVCLPGFLPYFLQSDQFHERALSISVGSLSPTINWKTLVVQEFLLPPVAEQLLIIKVLESANNAVSLFSDASIDDLRMSLIHSVFRSTSGRSRELCEFAEISIGGIWGSASGVDECDVEIVRQTEFCENATIAIGEGETRSISKSQLASRQLQERDILVQKSAGTPTLCGRVVRVEKKTDHAVVCSNFLHMLRIKGPVECSDFVFWALWYLHRAGRVFDLQRGTSIKNLEMSRYLKQRIPDLTSDELRDFSTQMRAIDHLDKQLIQMRINLRTVSHALREKLLMETHVQ